MLFRCRICDEEYTVLEVLGLLDDQLCPVCEDEVLSTMAEWEMEDRNIAEKQCAAHTELVEVSQVGECREDEIATHGEHNGSGGREEETS